MKPTTVFKILILFVFYMFPLVFASYLPVGQLVFTQLVVGVCLVLLFLGNIFGFLGNADYNKGNMDSANNYLKLAILKDAKNPSIYLNYANILMENFKYEDALIHLKTANAFNTDETWEAEIHEKMRVCEAEVAVREKERKRLE